MLAARSDRCRSGSGGVRRQRPGHAPDGAVSRLLAGNHRPERRKDAAGLRRGWLLDRRIGALRRAVLGVAALRLYLDGSAETGGSAALTLFGRSYLVETATAGVRGQVVMAEVLGDAGRLMALGLIGYRRQFGVAAPTALLAFRGGGTAFRVACAPLVADTARAFTGLDWEVAPGTLVGLAYHGLLGRRARDHAVKGSFSYRW